MLKRTLLIYSLLSMLLITGCISGGSNSLVTAGSADMFPQIEGVNLHGDTVALPDGFSGDPIIVIVAYEHAQQEIINPWLPHLDELEQTMPGLSYYELPVIESRTAAQRLMITNGMRMGITEDAARSRTITVFTDREAFNQAIGVTDMDTIYLFVLDGQKRITYRTQGAYSEEAFSALEAALQ